MKITGKTGIKNLEKYAKEINRKHFKQNEVRVFENPTSKNAFIIVKDNKFKLIDWNSISSDKSKFKTVLKNFNKLLDAEY